jgi:MFS family permease
VELVATLGVSWLGDRFGTVRVVVLGLIGVIILAVPQFLVLETGSTALIFLALALMRLVMAATYGPIARVLAQMYPPEARYTSVSLAYQVAGAIFGGLSPLVCTALYAATGTIYSVAGLLILMALVSIACLVKAPRYRDSDVLAAAEA